MGRLVSVILLLSACSDNGGISELDCAGADAGDPRCQVAQPPVLGGPGDTTPPPPDTVSSNAVIYRVATDTGDRQVVSDNNTGAGPPFKVPFGMVYDTMRSELVVIGESKPTPRVLAVDPETGDRRIITGAGQGTGPELEGPVSIAIDAATDQVFVLDRVRVMLVRVDLATGDRRMVSDNDTGDGPSLHPPSALAIDGSGGRAFVGRGGSRSILVVDLNNGDRVEISGEQRGTGPELRNVLALAHDPARNRLLVIMRDAVDMLAIDLATGDRTVVTTLPLLHGISIDGDQAVITTRSAVYLLDLLTGIRTLISSNDSAGSGPDFREVWAGSFDPLSNDVFVVDSGGGGP